MPGIPAMPLGCCAPAKQGNRRDAISAGIAERIGIGTNMARAFGRRTLEYEPAREHARNGRRTDAERMRARSRHVVNARFGLSIGVPNTAYNNTSERRERSNDRRRDHTWVLAGGRHHCDDRLWQSAAGCERWIVATK